MANGPQWKVIHQMETQQPDQSGAYVNGVQVTFQLQDGATGSVFVPESQYKADYVKQKIDQKAKLMHEVQNLQG
jgi:hypothetical protein